MRAQPRPVLRALGTLAALAMACLGCKGILDLEPGEPFPPDGGGGTGALGGGGTGGGGTGGGTGACGGGDADHVWSWMAGDQYEQEGTDVAFSPDGSRVVFGGRFKGSVDFGGGPLESAGSSGAWDGFVAAFDSASGGHLWSVRIGGPDDDAVWAVGFDSTGNIVASGSFTGTVDLGAKGPVTANCDSDVFIVRLGPSTGQILDIGEGAQLCLLDGSGAVFLQDMAVDPNDNIYLAGYLENTARLCASPICRESHGEDGFVVKLDVGINVAWRRYFASGPQGNQRVDKIAARGSTGIWVGGSFMPGLVLEDDAGSPYTLFNVTNSDTWAFVASLDASGGTATDPAAWSMGLTGSTTYQQIGGLAVDSENNLVVALHSIGGVTLAPGTTASGQGDGATDIHLMRYGPTGPADAPLWHQPYLADDNQWVHHVGLDAGDNIALSGVFRGTFNLGGQDLTSVGLGDIFVGAISSAGDHVWSRSLGGDGEDGGYHAVAAPFTGVGVALTARAESDLDLGSGCVLSNAGSGDVIGALYDPSQ